MIIVKIKAGLGNQMFQYAFGRRLSLDWSDELKFDLSWFDNIQEGETPREIEINKFYIVMNKVSESDITKAKLGLFKKVLEKIKGRLDRNYFYKFHPSLLKKKKNIFLDGYFQSYKYIDSIRERLLRDFVLKGEYCEEAKIIKKKIEKAGQSVAIHVRRGDFAASCKDWNGLCSVEYYTKALDEIKKKYSDVELFIFSDDIGWVKENFKFDNPTTLVSGLGLNAVEELLLMSLCKHQIIANSTFSWWAAWLNKNEKKIVVAPSRWLVTAKINADDLLPPDWIKI